MSVSDVILEDMSNRALNLLVGRNMLLVRLVLDMEYASVVDSALL